MPRSTDPLATVRITLDSDRDASPVPVFLFSPPTMRKERSLGNLFDRLVDVENPDAMFDLLNGELTDGLLGWENMGVDFSPDSFGEVVNATEAIELARHLLSSGRLTSEEKKSSESPD